MTAPGRPTIVMKVVNTILEDLVRFIVGVVVMVGGGWLVGYEAKHPPASTLLIIAGLVATFVGFLMIPGVFNQFKVIIIFVAPYAENAPVIGPMFRRKDDKPQPPPDPAAKP